MSVWLRTTVRCDLYRYDARSGAREFFRRFLRVPGFRFTVILRCTQAFRRERARFRWFVFKVLLHHYCTKYGVEISERTEIGPGFYIGHLGGVIINSLASIGANVNIAHGVTVGQTNRGANKGVPRIGDRVWLGAHAIVVGNITVGDGALIGPGAFVNFDVPPNAVVIGNPGRIVSEGGTSGYISNIAAGNAEDRSR